MAKFETSLKVRTYECDTYGHVNNAVFLQYMEVARVELLNYMDFSLESLMKENILLPIIRIEIDYKKPVFADEYLALTIEWVKRGHTSATFRQEIIRQSDNTIATVAHVTWVSTNLEGRPVKLPETLIEAYKSKIDRTV